MLYIAQSTETANSFIENLKDIPPSTIFIWAGLIFLLLTVVNKVGGIIEVQAGQRKYSGSQSSEVHFILLEVL